jgi:hypothetical protein
VYANDEARRRQWQAEIRAKAEAERHQWKERARRAAETADKKEATRPPPEPTPAGEWINVYRPSMSISMKIWWASIWLFIFGWALGSVEMGIRWMVSG